jgi:hypothetical protein
MKNLLQERAYMALLKTMNDLPLPEVEEIETEPRNQWHQRLLEQANQPPVSNKHWPTEPCRAYERDSYDWPSNAI